MNKLIYISNSILPSNSANSVHVMKMCAGLSKSKLEVCLLAKTKDSSVDKSKIFNDYAVKETFSCVLFSLLNVPFCSLFISFILYPLYVVINREKNSIVYSRNRHASFVLALLYVQQTYELHGIAGNKFQRWMDRFICRKSSTNRVVAISNILKLDCIKLMNVQQEKIIVAHDGADLVDITNVKPKALRGDFEFNVGYTGSLLEGKGVDLLCLAASRLPELGFHIIGGTEMHVSALKSKFKEMDNVCFYGHVNQSLVQSYLCSFDLAVLPNKAKVITGNGEDIGKYTSPLKLFEYMSFNKEIVMSDLPVLREILDEQYVSFFEPDSVDALVQSIALSALGGGNYLSRVELLKDKYTWNARAKLVLCQK